MLASSAIVIVWLTGAAGGELYDSGWAVSPPPGSPAASVLGPSEIRVDRLLNQRMLKRLELPERAPEEESKKPQWRRPRVAQKPHAAVPPAGAPASDPQPPSAPPIADAFRLPDMSGQHTAPEARSVPKPDERETPAQRDHVPAPFSADAPQPLAGVDEGDVEERPRLDPKPDPIEPPAEDDQSPRRAPARDEEAAVDKPRSVEDPNTEAPEAEAEDTSPAPQAPAPTTANPRTTPQAERNRDEPQPSTTPKRETQPEREQPEQQKPARRQRSKVKTYEPPQDAAEAKRALTPLTRTQQYLRQRLRSVLSYYYRRPLNSMSHDPWEVMHGMLAYGLYSRIQDGGPRGKPLTAVGYLCFNRPCKRRQMLYVTPEGNLDVRVGVGLQGHKGQLLAMLAQCHVSPDYPIRVDGEEFTVRDLIEAEQLTCYARTELTFKLIALAHYLPSDATWVNDQGETWSIPKLIQDERTQPIRGAACGGTHRLAGLALAAKKRVARGEPLDGEWLEAAKFVEQYQHYAFQLQNRDGSLSTEWFRGRGAEDEIDRRVQTTGHILEWLIYSLPEERLHDVRTVRAVNYLTSLLASNTQNGWEVGPLSHALHALLLYDEKVFRPHDEPTQTADGRTRPVQLNYLDMNSPVSESYSYVEMRHAQREESSGLGGLFGFGSSRRR